MMKIAGILFASIVVTLIPLVETRAASALVFDPEKNVWVRKQGVTIRPQVSRSDASPVPREEVSFPNSFKTGTIVIETAERRLYRVTGKNSATRYAIGVGREGFAWKGQEKISRKAEWPRWTPPEDMRRREALNGRILPNFMEGGPENPLGARALYLGNTLYRIHGTNQPWTIGQAVSSGCIRMANEDVIDLFSKVKLGDLVVVR